MESGIILRLTMDDVQTLAMIDAFIGQHICEEGLDKDQDITELLARWQEIEKKVEMACDG